MLPSSVYAYRPILQDSENERENTETFAIRENENVDVNDETSTEPSYLIRGRIDDLNALKQSIFLRLNIEADQYIIYPYTYGLKTVDLIGKPYYYVMAVIPGRITEALLMDDRITAVTDFEFEVKKNKLGVKFVVHSIYGEVEEETVVTY